MSASSELTIDNRRLTVTNLDKVMYPSGFTKAQVIDYYVRIAPAMLPHLAEHPITLKRYPDGAAGWFFYEKRCPVHRPDWVDTTAIRVKSGVIDFCFADDPATLAWLGNLASLELHTYLYRRADPSTPTMMVFDLDPGAPAGLLDSCRIGLELRGLLRAHGLEALAKASGSKGLHVHVPLNTPIGFERTKAYARATALALERRLPEAVTSVMSKSERTGKVFIDWSQNDFAKTTCCVYSLRARERPVVSAPVTWEEIERAVASGDAEPLLRDAPAVLDLVRRRGDLFADLETLRQRLPDHAPDAAPAARAPRPPRRSAAARSAPPRAPPAASRGRR
jgi:bifunctional non-homologous end joining protein LigD